MYQNQYFMNIYITYIYIIYSTSRTKITQTPNNYCCITLTRTYITRYSAKATISTIATQLINDFVASSRAYTTALWLLLTSFLARSIHYYSANAIQKRSIVTKCRARRNGAVVISCKVLDTSFVYQTDSTDHHIIFKCITLY